MSATMLYESDRKEIIGQIDEMLKFADEQLHPIVSPDNWWIYANLHDDLEQLKITVNQKFEIGKQAVKCNEKRVYRGAERRRSRRSYGRTLGW